MSFHIITVDSIPSTNTALKDWAGGDGVLSAYGPLRPLTVVRAVTQTGGRGRLGRQFVSPPGGLYMSLYLPASMVRDPLTLTPRICACVCLALENAARTELQIKWVNDLYLNGKKVCGILCEGIPGGFVCGIGVNLKTPEGGFPPEAGPAGALDREGLTPEGLMDAILKRLLPCLEDGFLPEVVRMYRARNMLLGQEVLWRNGADPVPCVVTGIGDDLSLTVRDPSGRAMSLRTGETLLKKEGPAR